MREMSKKAKKIPSVELTFRNLYLNQRVAAHALFVSPAVWERCAGWPESEDELLGRPSTIAIDLSARTDLTAISAATVLDSGKKVLETYAFTPADTLEERSVRDRAPYVNWVKQGYLTATPGNTVSYEFVAKKLLELCATRDVRAIVFDRWRFDQFKKVVLDLDPAFDEELLKPFGQGYKDMSPAVDTMEEALLNQEIMHGGHPVLRWAFANAVLEQDAAGNKKLTKAKSYGRIDPAVAAVMAIGAVGTETVDTSSMIGLL
jgi:phage terminase large subunit-like protein